MYLNKNELTIVYNGDHYKSKQTLSIAKSMFRKINIQDITNERISVNLFCSLLSRSNISPKQLVNKADFYYQHELRKSEYSDESWFYILKNNPNLLINPLVLYKNKGGICLTPTDILKIA
ncbi:MAG: arsenate reductase-like glutaredoxin family protein [Salibacteraceae bacterium]|jgi:arsenate reductase-like glutaredoxin family protein